MTRWARSEKSNKKQEHDASSWEDLSCSSAGDSNQNRGKQSNSSYTERVTNKNRRSRNRFRLEEKKNLNFFKESSEHEEDDSIIEFHGPVDEIKPGIASELEKLGVQKDQTSDKKSREMKNSKKKKLKLAKKVLETELTEQLGKLKKEEKDLAKQDLQEIEDMIKKDQRREHRRLKRKQGREDSKVCFHCRKAGHAMEDCTEKKVDSAEGVCFKCGSTEHSIQKCKANVPPGQFPFAKCFICGEKGHLSKMCPDNPKGLYPKGGCCRTCGSVEHYKKDCPELQKKSGVEEYFATTIAASSSVDDDSFVMKKSEIFNPVPKKKTKVVKF